MNDPATRASDEDRDRTAAFLRDNHVAGRLAVEEFDDRLDKALTARTLGDLAELTKDLPQPGPGRQPPEPSVPDAGGGLPGGQRPGVVPADQDRTDRFSPAWRAAWGSWLTVSLVVFVIWLLTGMSGGPWFLWVALPLGAVLLARWLTGSPVGGSRQQLRSDRLRLRYERRQMRDQRRADRRSIR